MMNTAAVLSAFDQQLRRNAPPDDSQSTVEFTGDVVRQTSTASGWNGVLWSDLREETADAVIAQQIAHFTAHGLGFEWKHYAHDQPADLPQRLLAAGFVAEPRETLVIGESAAQAVEVPVPAGITLRPVLDADGVDLMMRVHEQAFGTDSGRLRHWVLNQMAELGDRFAAVVAMHGDLPVSAGRVLLHEGTDFASLWSGGTVPEWRGRGIYRSLVAHRARYAAERGYRYLQVDASDDSRPILERLGFAALTVTTPFQYTP
ncbi:GNAT family N-acetyltransferase [Nonomuraea sp. NPDC050310]|uniref:GNAT family N-acetyltransferase n=1 Tax=Nonomuraea sp. NPDC050310 TaxID=3154935 RepID=UPI0033FC911A